MSGATYSSVIERLMNLPEAFSVNGFVTSTGLSKPSASVYLARWSAAGYIKASGPRTGFYFNVLKNKEAPDIHKVAALLHVYPTAMVRGASVLHRLGITTQVPHEIDVAVLAPANRAHTDGFIETPRSQAWFRAVFESRKSHGAFGLPELSPEMALADLYADPNSWHPDPDDLELDEIDWTKFAQCCATLKTPVPELLEQLVREALSQQAKLAIVAPVKAARRKMRP